MIEHPYRSCTLPNEDRLLQMEEIRWMTHTPSTIYQFIRWIKSYQNPSNKAKISLLGGCLPMLSAELIFGKIMSINLNLSPAIMNIVCRIASSDSIFNEIRRKERLRPTFQPHFATCQCRFISNVNSFYLD